MPKLDYGVGEGKGLSYSRLLTLHACPRKFQFENILNMGNRTNNVDFAYGHAVALGIQTLISEPGNLNKAIVACASQWNMTLEDIDYQGKKSLGHAIQMVKQFNVLMRSPEANFLQNFEVAKFPGPDGSWRYAIELTFCINCYDGYIYEGHIDLVLKHKVKDEYMVVELKTTKSTEVNDAQYKNSAQALGYSVVLDSIATSMDATGSYFVLYIVVKSSRQEFDHRIYAKTRADRAEFINGLILDIETAEMYRRAGIYPMYGESCFNFFRACEFFGMCQYPADMLERHKKSHGDEEGSFSKLTQYDFVYNLDEIQRTQVQYLNLGED